MNKFFKIFLPIIFILFFALVVWAYWWNFWMRPISDNPENWGQFWDYIWWLSNPIIGLANVVLLVYVSLILEKQNSHRELMPLSQIDEEILKNINWSTYNINIKVKNVWLWPMIMTNIVIIWSNNQSFNWFEEIVDNLKKIQQDINYSYIFWWKKLIIEKSDKRMLLEVKVSEWNTLNEDILKYISQLTINLEFTDLFDNKFIESVKLR